MRQKNYFFLSLLLIWIISAILTGIFDLKISKSIVNENSNWAIFLEKYGMLPGIFVLLIGGYLYYSFLTTHKSKFNFLKKGFFFLAANFLILYIFGVIAGRPELKNLSAKFYLIAASSVLINILVITTLHLKKIVLSELVIEFSHTVIALGLWGYIISIQLVKTIWGRVRFRELDAAFSQFTPWYLPQGINGFDSFPSGHAAMGWMILPLIILVNNKKLFLRNVIIVSICCWGILLSVSRVVVGAHYLSDVLFSSFFIITIYYFSQKHFSTKQHDG